MNAALQSEWKDAGVPHNGKFESKQLSTVSTDVSTREGERISRVLDDCGEQVLVFSFTFKLAFEVNAQAFHRRCRLYELAFLNIVES